MIRTYNYKDSRRAGTAIGMRVRHWHRVPFARTARRAYGTHSLHLPACRCTDHRLSSNFALDSVLSGQVEPVVGACIAMDQQQQLEEMQAK